MVGAMRRASMPPSSRGRAWRAREAMRLATYHHHSMAYSNRSLNQPVPLLHLKNQGKGHDDLNHGEHEVFHRRGTAEIRSTASRADPPDFTTSQRDFANDVIHSMAIIITLWQL